MALLLKRATSFRNLVNIDSIPGELLRQISRVQLSRRSTQRFGGTIWAASYGTEKIFPRLMCEISSQYSQYYLDFRCRRWKASKTSAYDPSDPVTLPARILSDTNFPPQIQLRRRREEPCCSHPRLRSEGDPPFYIVKNSWGTAFGDRGYLYIAIGENLCGIADKISRVSID